MAAANAEKHVFVLEDEEPVAVVEPVRPVAEPTADAMVDEIHILDTMTVEAPVAEAPKPAPAPVYSAPEPGRSAFENENDVKTTADRIRRIHDLLRNNANGADIVQSMPATREYAETDLYEGRHSSDREAPSFSMRADGSLAKNTYYDAGVD